MMALLPLLVSLAGEYGPALTKMLLGQKAGDVTGTIINAAKEIFGTEDPASIDAAVKANPELAQLYIERIKADTQKYQIEEEGVKDARAQTVSLVQANSAIAWGAPVVSIVVVVGFVVMLIIWMVFPPTYEPALLSVLNILVGTLASAFGAVVQYWLGSSAGSRQKDELLNTALVTAQLNTGKAITKAK